MGSSRILTDFNFQVSRILVNWPDVFFICIVEILLSLTLSFYGSSRLFSVHVAFKVLLFVCLLMYSMRAFVAT